MRGAFEAGIDCICYCGSARFADGEVVEISAGIETVAAVCVEHEAAAVIAADDLPDVRARIIYFRYRKGDIKSVRILQRFNHRIRVAARPALSIYTVSVTAGCRDIGETINLHWAG